MNAAALKTAWYRFRATFAQRRGGYLAIVLLLGLVGGVSLGSIAGARRTHSSYATYVASTNPSDLRAYIAFLNPQFGITKGYSPKTAATIAHLPFVRHEAVVVGFDANIDRIEGAHVRVGPASKPPSLEGSLGGEYTTQDRSSVVAGRLPRSGQPEAVMNAEAAKQLGVHIGSVITLLMNSDAQLLSPANNPPPAKTVRIRMVGEVVFPNDVSDDDYDARGSSEVLVSPSVTRELASCCATYSYSALSLVGGTSNIGRVETEISGVIPAQLISAVGFRTWEPIVESAERAINPEAVALGVFGGLAALAAIVITAQVIGRQLRVRAGDLQTLRALGASPSATLGDATIGVIVSVAAGSLLAVVVAVAVSPLFPLGPVRPVYPLGLGFDWTALGLGFAISFALLGTLALLLAVRQAPHRTRRHDNVSERPSVVARAAAALGLPAPAVTGIRFALEPGDAVPVRSAIFGAVMAVLVIVATVTFGASLNRLVSHPSLYGWNWNYALFSTFAGDEDLPAHLTATMLQHDHEVTAASGIYLSSGDIDGQRGIPLIGATPNAPVAPTITSGHGLWAKDQIVLGASTLSALHTRLGATVNVGTGGDKSHPLVVVGTATMPAIVGPGMGIGAVIDEQLIPAAVRNTQGNTIPGPNVYLIRTRAGDSAAALLSLDKITVRINRLDSDGPAGGPSSVLRPAAIVNSRSIETIPTVLGASLAVGAVVALGITLVASIRRRRRDLAVMKALGLAGRQLATVVAWQASVAVAVGVLLGVPLGIVVGRLLWNLFARGLDVVPAPSVPALTVAAIALGAIVLANVVAALPGRIAARTPTALLLRVE